MAVNERRRKVRSESAAMDLLYIAVGIAVVLMAAASFLDPKGNMVFFPIIFFLAAVLNLTSGRKKFGRSKRDARKRAGAILQLAFGTALAFLTVISGISIWWR